MPLKREKDDGPEAAGLIPAEEKAVSGPPADKALKRGKPCPRCGPEMRPYKGAQAHKSGRQECDACGFHE